MLFWGRTTAGGLTEDDGQVKKTEHFKILNIPDRTSAGVEIDPTPLGIIFSLLGFPGGHKSKKSKQSEFQAPWAPEKNN